MSPIGAEVFRFTSATAVLLESLVRSRGSRGAEGVDRGGREVAEANIGSQIHEKHDLTARRILVSVIYTLLSPYSG